MSRSPRAGSTFVSTALALLCAYFTAEATAAAVVPDKSASVLAKAQAEAARLRARARAGGSTDTMPPKLTKFALVGSVDAQQQGAAAIADMAITDDLSGVQFVTLTLTSPSGAQSATLYNILSSGARKYAGKFSVGSMDLLDFGGRFTRFSEPGTWTATMMLVTDAAGNLVIYSASDLAALGNTNVTVTNAGGYDVIPPDVAKGTIQTTKISLSKPPRGMPAGTPPFLRARLDVTDAGNGAVSGAKIASMSFCLPDGFGECLDTIELDGTADATHLAQTTVRMEATPRDGQMTGTYHLYQVFVEDVAGNLNVITTGLDALFPDGTMIDVLP